jgi:hypothetical protein
MPSSAIGASTPMNDIKLAFENMDEIIRASTDNLTVSERAGLYAAIHTLSSKLDEYIKEKGLSGYASEKNSKVRFHVSAALGFDINNGHSIEQHRVWAYGDLSTLKDLLTE